MAGLTNRLMKKSEIEFRRSSGHFFFSIARIRTEAKSSLQDQGANFGRRSSNRHDHEIGVAEIGGRSKNDIENDIDLVTRWIPGEIGLIRLDSHFSPDYRFQISEIRFSRSQDHGADFVARSADLKSRRFQDRKIEVRFFDSSFGDLADPWLADRQIGYRF